MLSLCLLIPLRRLRPAAAARRSGSPATRAGRRSRLGWAGAVTVGAQQVALRRGRSALTATPAALTPLHRSRRRCSCCRGRCSRCRWPPPSTRRWRPPRPRGDEARYRARAGRHRPGRGAAGRPRRRRAGRAGRAGRRVLLGAAGPARWPRHRRVRARACSATALFALLVPGPVRPRRDRPPRRVDRGRLGGRRGRRAAARWRAALPGRRVLGAGPGQRDRHDGHSGCCWSLAVRRHAGAGGARRAGRARGRRRLAAAVRRRGWPAGPSWSRLGRVLGGDPGGSAASLVQGMLGGVVVGWSSFAAVACLLDRRDLRPLVADAAPPAADAAPVTTERGRGSGDRGRDVTRATARWRGSVALVLGSSTGGIGQHVALAGPRPGRGRLPGRWSAGPAATDEQFGFTAAGARRSRRWRSRPAPARSDSGAVRALRRALAGRDADVVHAHGLRAGFVAALARPGRAARGHLAQRGARQGPARAGRRALVERIVARDRRRSPSAPPRTWSSGPSRSAPATPGSAPVAAPALRRAAAHPGRGARRVPASPPDTPLILVGRPAAPAEALRRADRRRRPLA